MNANLIGAASDPPPDDFDKELENLWATLLKRLNEAMACTTTTPATGPQTDIFMLQTTAEGLINAYTSVVRQTETAQENDYGLDQWLGVSVHQLEAFTILANCLNEARQRSGGGRRVNVRVCQRTAEQLANVIPAILSALQRDRLALAMGQPSLSIRCTHDYVDGRCTRCGKEKPRI